ncbi:MAG: sialate O-acetylesterase, partial [Oscillospiraceae bacterium]|nr:sialate O-acetylesterase [Oscillospiraceae bacterium]
LPEENGIRVYLDYAECGLESRGEGGFELCGTDGVWHPAKAELNGSTIFVHSKEVPHPAAARYGWRNYLPVTVFAKNGLPLAPFRTNQR